LKPTWAPELFKIRAAIHNLLTPGKFNPALKVRVRQQVAGKRRALNQISAKSLIPEGDVIRMLFPPLSVAIPGDRKKPSE